VVLIPERTVKVNLIAQVNGYIAGMEQAAARTRTLGTEAEKLAAKRQAIQQLGTGLLAFGALAAAAVGIAVKKFADFDAQMSNTQAATQASAEDLILLRDAALDAGGATVFTATEAAQALEELGKASLGTKNSIDALGGTLALAASGQIEVARAAEVMATTLKQFGLDGTQAGHVADVLSAGAGKALGSVEDLAQGLKFVGPVAASMGVSLEETTGALALFADQGIIGEQAGTSLRGVLSSLTSPSSEAGKEIERLGIKLYDTGGRFLGVENTAGQLDKAFGGLTDQQRDLSLGLIFGNQQVTAARVLFQGGAKDVAKYTAEVNDTGYAARIAAQRMDNLKGDVEKLGGAFDTALIKSGSGANDVLRILVQSVTGLVDLIGGLPTPVLGAGLAIGGLTAAVALAGGGFLVLAPKIAAAKTALGTLGITAKSAAIGIGTTAGALTAATLVIGYFVQKQAEATANTAEFKDSLDQLTGATTEYTRELVAKKLAEAGAFDVAEQAGISQRELTDAVLEGGDALIEANVKMSAVATNNPLTYFLPFLGLSAKNAATDVSRLGDSVVQAGDNLDDEKAAAKGSAESTQDAAAAYQSAASKAEGLNSNLNSLIDTINKANGVGQDAVSTNAAYQRALADVREKVGSLEGGLDESTEAGSANSDMLADLAKKSQDAAKAQLELDGNSDAYYATVAAGRQALYDNALAISGNADAAQALTDKVYGIPTTREVQLTVEASQAKRELDGVQASLDKFRNSGVTLSAYVNRLPNENGNLYGGGRPQAFADGGFPTGIYAGRQGGIHKFAEENVGWEAYISGKPGQGDRNRAIWAEAGQRLGVSPTQTSATRNQKIDLNVSGVDPEVAAERVYQRLKAGLANL